MKRFYLTFTLPILLLAVSCSDSDTPGGEPSPSDPREECRFSNVKATPAATSADFSASYLYLGGFLVKENGFVCTPAGGGAPVTVVCERSTEPGLHAARPRARNRLRTLLLCSCRRPYLPQRNDFVHHARKGRGARTDTRREGRLRHADHLGAHRHLGHGRRHLHLRRRSDGHRRGVPAEKGGAERRDQTVVRYGSDLAALHLHRSERKHLLRGRGLRRHAVEDLAQHGRRVHHRGRRRHAARQQYPPQRLGGTAERSVERRLPLRRP